jgi:hypothetical protein
MSNPSHTFFEIYNRQARIFIPRPQKNQSLAEQLCGKFPLFMS